MRTLFVKMFIWFWAASSLAGIISFILGVNTRPTLELRNAALHQELHVKQARPVVDALLLYGYTAASILERDGTAMNIASNDFDAYLFTENGAPLSARTPHELVVVAQAAAARKDKTYPYVTSDDVTDVAAIEMTGPSGKQYIAVGTMQADLPEKRSFSIYLPADIWMRIGVSSVIMGLASFVLVWWMASPIRQMRATAKRLADGDLTARVSLKELSGKNDDLVSMGRDINLMAVRIEKLIETNKQLVRDVAHELRSPLARLNVALGLARQENANRSQKALDRIELEAERLNFLISDLLVLSQMEGGEDTLEKEPFSLSDVVEEVTSDADFEAAGKNRQVLLLQVEETTLLGNRELLRSAIENIVRNGIRYTKEGTDVEVSLVHSPLGEALLKIRDHGPGVPESALSNIFHPFYRVAEDRGRNSGGAGVGLAIAAKTVRLFRGTIQAHNSSDGGLEIEMRLPLTERKVVTKKV
ncbi:MAG TPA: HAMP domain-containing protein [Desulfuromonadales bacterium]|nr:HAMP domain-containing protein [Desulfuromonadales bacterium]